MSRSRRACEILALIPARTTVRRLETHLSLHVTVQNTSLSGMFDGGTADHQDVERQVSGMHGWAGVLFDHLEELEGIALEEGLEEFGECGRLPKKPRALRA